MGRRKPAHAYDPAMQRALQGIVLPPKIKCGRCEKFKIQTNFSAKQLNDARAAIYNKGKGASYRISCRQCTGGPLVEIECVACGVTKGVEAFAKVQRAKPDTAKCFECVDKQLETEPVNEELYENPANAFVPLDSSAGNYPDYWAETTSRSGGASRAMGDDDWDSDGDEGGVRLNGAFSQMALSHNQNRTGTGTLIDTSVDTDGNDVNQGGPVNENTGWQTAQKKSRPNAGALKTGSTSGYSKAFGSNMTERSENKKAWAKIKAYKPEKQPEPLSDDDWKSESEDETNEDDDDEEEDDDTEI